MPLFVGASESYDTDAWEAYNLKKENAKLRELVVLWSVINKHMSLCATTDCGQCPVREECEESVYLEGLLGIDPKRLGWRVQERIAETPDVQAENTKLRELIAEVHEALRADKAGMFHKLILANMEDDMRELGVEVSK